MLNERTTKITTHCKDCVFNIKKDGDQEGCKLSRIERFIELGQAELREYDGNRHYAINRLCNACRNSAWADTKKDIMSALKREINLNIDYLVLAPDNSLEKICATIDSLDAQDHQPNVVVICVSSNAEYVFKRLRNYTKLNVFVTQFAVDFDPVYWTDHAIKHCNGDYYSVVNAGEQVNNLHAYIANYLFNEQLEQFLILEGESPMPTLYQMTVHKLLVGNKGGSLLDKVRFLAVEQNNTHMIKKWKDVIKS